MIVQEKKNSNKNMAMLGIYILTGNPVFALSAYLFALLKIVILVAIFCSQQNHPQQPDMIETSLGFRVEHFRYLASVFVTFLGMVK